MDQRRARGQRTRSALIDAALDLFAAQGYAATTVEQIASRAQVSARTFHHHFPAKEDILFDGYGDRLDAAVEQFRTAGNRTLAGALGRSSQAVAESIAEHPEMFVVRARLYRTEPELRATMLRINDDWIERMTTQVAHRLSVDPRLDLRPRLAATLTNGANRSAIDVWVTSGGVRDLRELMAEAVALLEPTLRGIERSITHPEATRVP